jgi:hypothetical protein
MGSVSSLILREPLHKNRLKYHLKWLCLPGEKELGGRSYWSRNIGHHEPADPLRISYRGTPPQSLLQADVDLHAGEPAAAGHNAGNAGDVRDVGGRVGGQQDEVRALAESNGAEAVLGAEVPAHAAQAVDVTPEHSLGSPGAVLSADPGHRVVRWGMHVAHPPEGGGALGGPRPRRRHGEQHHPDERGPAPPGVDHL